MHKTLLIVEDEFLIAIDLKLLLERRGWSVLGPATTVKEALALLDDELPAVALLDVSLKDGSVTLVAEALRARKVPFVVASAYSRPELIGGDVLAGAPGVGKPTEEHRLLAVLENAVRS
ncbi:response regulator [Sinorhizobium americanum]|uniref:Response regulator receiver domain-containing protein n=1 Tax=Sinorhizobium americanum TaxID=194963 RepID=A0A4R2B7U4_9HYPH|nr:response regulator [Sinorhizobium americanum]TCN22132.1 response regulator receiver domain-containing protein [Sinorhizobium americanum]